MARRYALYHSAGPDDNFNWLEAIETWSQRTRRKLEWMVDRSGSDQYNARIRIDGELVSQIVGSGRTPRSARIDLVRKIDNSDPAILTI